MKSIATIHKFKRGKPMRIGMLADTYKPYVSGVTNVIDLTKRYLESQGHDVYVFTFGDENYHDDEPNVVRSPGLPLVDTGFYINVRYSRDARKLLQTMDIVHVHHPFLSGRLALWFCKPRGIPIVFTNHTRYDLYAQAYFPVLPDGIGDVFLKAFIPGFCDSTDMVVAPSNGLKQVLKRAGVTNHVQVVPNGVDMSPFHREIEPIDRSEFNFTNENVILVFSGRIAPEKNLPFLLRAFNGAAQAYENLCLLILGDGPDRENLEDRVRHMGIENRVFFTGMVKYEQMPRYLVTADAFVTASVTEVHPLSVIEAMGAGLPVLGIQSPGVGDTVTDGKDGYIVPDEDLAAFTAKMVRLATDADLRKKMSVNAKKTSDLYNYERTSQQMYALYEQVIANSTGQRRSARARWIRFWDQLR
jgi:glycosyltransferase involved in cell wall biosynthesis